MKTNRVTTQGFRAMTNAIVKIKPSAGKEAMVVLTYAKEEKKASIIATVKPSYGLGIKFDSISEDDKKVILEAVKKCVATLDTIIIDLSLDTQVSEFVPQATGYRSPAMKREDWRKQQEISKEKSFDNLHNEGGEGYNPYR